MFYSDALNFRINLNGLIDDRVFSSMDLIVSPSFVSTEPYPGQTVRVTTEDGDIFPAVIQSVRDRGIVELVVKFDAPLFTPVDVEGPWGALKSFGESIYQDVHTHSLKGVS